MSFADGKDATVNTETFDRGSQHFKLIDLVQKEKEKEGKKPQDCLIVKCSL